MYRFMFLKEKNSNLFLRRRICFSPRLDSLNFHFKKQFFFVYNHELVTKFFNRSFLNKSGFRLRYKKMISFSKDTRSFHRLIASFFKGDMSTYNYSSSLVVNLWSRYKYAFLKRKRRSYIEEIKGYRLVNQFRGLFHSSFLFPMKSSEFFSCFYMFFSKIYGIRWSYKNVLFNVFRYKNSFGHFFSFSRYLEIFFLSSYKETFDSFERFSEQWVGTKEEVFFISFLLFLDRMIQVIKNFMFFIQSVIIKKTISISHLRYYVHRFFLFVRDRVRFSLLYNIITQWNTNFKNILEKVNLERTNAMDATFICLVELELYLFFVIYNFCFCSIIFTFRNSFYNVAISFFFTSLLLWQKTWKQVRIEVTLLREKYMIKFTEKRLNTNFISPIELTYFGRMRKWSVFHILGWFNLITPFLEEFFYLYQPLTSKSFFFSFFVRKFSWVLHSFLFCYSKYFFCVFIVVISLCDIMFGIIERVKKKIVIRKQYSIFISICIRLVFFLRKYIKIFFFSIKKKILRIIVFFSWYYYWYLGMKDIINLIFRASFFVCFGQWFCSINFNFLKKIVYYIRLFPFYFTNLFGFVKSAVDSFRLFTYMRFLFLIGCKSSSFFWTFSRSLEKQNILSSTIGDILLKVIENMDFFKLIRYYIHPIVIRKIRNLYYIESFFLWRRFFFGFEKRLSLFYDLRVLLRFCFYFEQVTYFNARIVITNFGRSFEERKRYAIKHLGKYPILVSAKMLSEFIVFRLDEGNTPTKAFVIVKKWQSFELRRKNGLLFLSNQRRMIVSRRIPLSGLRISFGGPMRKGGRRKRIHYHIFVRQEVFTKSMPFQKSCRLVEFYQLQVNRLSSAFGLKVWVFLNAITKRQDFVRLS